jgi:hypothetical protein
VPDFGVECMHGPDEARSLADIVNIELTFLFTSVRAMYNNYASLSTQVRGNGGHSYNVRIIRVANRLVNLMLL